VNNAIKIVVISMVSLFSLNTYADFLCYTVDQGGHYWRSTGTTEERATAVAMNFCSGNSPNGDTCQPAKCLEK